MKRSSPKKSRKAPPARPKDGWASLTWDDLDRWAGSRSVSRGRAYQRQGRVEDLAISDDGRLLATVEGGRRYVVSVSYQLGKKNKKTIESCCTCPVGYSCKHAVAAVAAYIRALADQTDVPVADADDPRWAELFDEEDEWEDDAGDWEEGDLDDSEDEEIQFDPRPRPKRGTAVGPARKDADNKIQEYIRAKSREELAELVISLTQRFPELHEEFRERIALAEGDVKRLLSQARRELQDLVSEPAWQNRWTGEGYTPDYSRLKHRMERMIELGHADAVADLGREFVQSAMRQVQDAHDEGETAGEVSDCMSVVMDGVAKSSLPTPKKILFAIDACLADEYDIAGNAVTALLDADWSESDWSAVADELRSRLSTSARQSGQDSASDFTRNYRRDQITDWLIVALEHAKRDNEILPLCQEEARKTLSYQRLVQRLIQARQFDDAQRWAMEGIEKTRKGLPGIASELANALCKMASARKQWDIVAAHSAMEFFDYPAIRTFDALIASAKKAKCADQVRAASLRFLETGVSPIQATESKKGDATFRIDPAWPLPVPEYLAPRVIHEGPRNRVASPHYDVLLDMAIAAKRTDDVLHWYDKMTSGKKSEYGRYGWESCGHSTADRVAEAVAKSHPERALEIYARALDAHLPHADIAAYEAAAYYLKHMRPIMERLGKKSEWSARLAQIREKYRNRPRFMGILDKLEGRTILATHKSRRRS